MGAFCLVIRLGNYISILNDLIVFTEELFHTFQDSAAKLRICVKCRAFV